MVHEDSNLCTSCHLHHHKFYVFIIHQWELFCFSHMERFDWMKCIILMSLCSFVFAIWQGQFGQFSWQKQSQISVLFMFLSLTMVSLIQFMKISCPTIVHCSTFVYAILHTSIAECVAEPQKGETLSTDYVVSSAEQAEQQSDHYDVLPEFGQNSEFSSDSFFK